MEGLPEGEERDGWLRQQREYIEHYDKETSPVMKCILDGKLFAEGMQMPENYVSADYFPLQSSGG